jgi:hypothetical protein
MGTPSVFIGAQIADMFIYFFFFLLLFFDNVGNLSKEEPFVLASRQ